MEELVNLLPASGSMLFNDFVQAARTARLRPELWHKAKRRGLLFTGFDAAGNLVISRNPVELFIAQ